MREIGGYIELDNYTLPMLHDDAIALNCGRNALAYIIRAKKIKKIYIPKFLCASVPNVCKKEGIKIEYYSIDEKFLPRDLIVAEDAWLYIVNYYGQINNEMIELLKNQYNRIIVDNSQAYFQMPVCGVDTLYTCRKYFGVPDGAFLYTDKEIEELLKLDQSYERMGYLLGRYERTANEFYSDYVAANRMFADEPIKKMSKLTRNLLHGIDYQVVADTRTQNFEYLRAGLDHINKLSVQSTKGAFMYPLYVDNGPELRLRLQEKKIYIPTLWPDVFDVCQANELEYDMAKNILPLPIDQRYSILDMAYLVETLMEIVKE